MTTTTAEKTETPKFEQTMQGLLAMLQGLPRDEAVTNATLVDWLLPLFEDARDEYHALATENADQIAAVAEDVDAAGADAPDDNARAVVTTLVGLVTIAYQRAGWLNADATALTASCPKDLSEEYQKVQTFVQAWASGVDVAALLDGATGEAGEEGDE